MTYAPSRDFADLLRVLLLSKGRHGDAELWAAHAGANVQALVKAASDVAELTAENTPGLVSAAAPFLEAIANASILDRWLADGVVTMPYAPPGPSALIATQIVAGGAVSEAAPKPVGELHLAENLVRSKAAVLVVMSQELARTPRGGPAAEQQLRASLVSALNSAVADMLLAEYALTTLTASGSTAADVLADLGDAASALGATDRSRLYLLVSPDTLLRLAFMAGTSGPAFLDLGATGGAIQSVPVLAAASLGGSSPVTALLVDGARIAVADGGLALSTATHASLELDDSPSGPAVFNLWQRNCVGLRAERPFAIGAGADTSSSPAVAITGAW